MVSRDELLAANKTYPIDSADRARAGIPAGVSAIWTGEIRRPKAGEWYLKAGDGSHDQPAVTAYCAGASLTSEHAIAKLYLPPDRSRVKEGEIKQQSQVLAGLIELI